MEIWKDIPKYEGYYQVSNLGRVKSFKKNKITILKNRDNKRGYYQVDLYLNGTKKSRNVHQLVAITFLNHKPHGHNVVVNHINNDKLDNSLSNLELISQRENANLKHIPSSSKYVGVSWDKKNKKWISRIRVNKSNKYLGGFDTEIEASNAYQAFLQQIPYHRI